MHYKFEHEDDNKRIAVQTSLYGGTAYNHFTGRENIFRICPKDDGVFGIAEVEYNRNGSSYYLGTSAYFNNNINVTPWFYAEQYLCKNLSILAGYSHAFAAEVGCKDFAGLGVHYKHAKCEFGLYSDYACFADAKEFATELTFKYNATEMLYIQPILHFIVTSSEGAKTEFNSIASLRIGISL